MRYQFVYYNRQVMEDIFAMPDKLLAKYLCIRDLMIDFGPNIGESHTKSFGKGLFEIRVKSQEGIARIFYCTLIGKRIMILHSFIKKTQKTPKKELNLALKRFKEVKNG